MEGVARLKYDRGKEQEKEGLRGELLLVTEDGYIVDHQKMVDQTNYETCSSRER